MDFVTLQPAGNDNRPIGMDLVIEAYKSGVDRTPLRANLRRSVDERMRNLVALNRFAEAVREAGVRARDLEAIAELEALREERSR